jgi:hypothetical protein
VALLVDKLDRMLGRRAQLQKARRHPHTKTAAVLDEVG